MAVKVKFPLKMANGSQVRTLEDLRENFDLASVLGYYDTGRLYDWLMVYYYEEEAKKISDLDSSADDFKESLCDILGATYAEDESVGVDLSDISERNERLAKLKTFTADDTILAAVDNVVFTQEELNSLHGKDVNVIYLCGEHFNISSHKGNVRYVGVNTPTVSIPKNFTAKDVVFHGIEFDLDYIVAQAKATQKAAELWRIVAERGHAEAQYWLGKCYYDGGYGVQENDGEALKWWHKAAEQGHVEAQYELGNAYYNGVVANENKDEAFKWYRKSAEHGYAEAQYWLGMCYAQGDGVTENRTEAVKWYRKAAEQGHADAQYKFGRSYIRGLITDETYIEPVKWWRKAAEQGHVEAQYELGNCYRNGRGVSKNNDEAFRLFHEAAEQGYAKVQHELGDCYYWGRGVDTNREEAVKWYRKAAEQGHAKAQNMLGGCYANGDGIDENEAEAVKWYRKAVEQGDYSAKENLAMLQPWDNINEIDEEVAECFRKAKKGDADAQYKLGMRYYNGIGFNKNIHIARRWFDKAMWQGHSGATKMSKKITKESSV